MTNLGFLTTEQALADFAEFLEYIKESVPGAQNSPVVVFGGSYGGIFQFIIYEHKTIKTNIFIVRNAGNLVQNKVPAPHYRVRFESTIFESMIFENQ